MGRTSYEAIIGQHPTKKIEIDPDQLKALAGQGLSQRQIGDALGVSTTTIRYHMKKHDVITNFKNDKSEERSKCLHDEPPEEIEASREHLLNGDKQLYCDICDRWIWESDWR